MRKVPTGAVQVPWKAPGRREPQPAGPRPEGEGREHRTELSEKERGALRPAARRASRSRTSCRSVGWTRGPGRGEPSFWSESIDVLSLMSERTAPVRDCLLSCFDRGRCPWPPGAHEFHPRASGVRSALDVRTWRRCARGEGCQRSGGEPGREHAVQVWGGRAPAPKPSIPAGENRVQMLSELLRTYRSQSKIS